MFWNNRRVEEDLERIRGAYVHHEVPAPDEAAPQGDGNEATDSLRVTARDIFMMCVAVFSLLLPFLLAIAVVLGLVLLWFFR